MIKEYIVSLAQKVFCRRRVVKNVELKFVLKVTRDPEVEELEFDSIEALQAKVAELTPKAEKADEGSASEGE